MTEQERQAQLAKLYKQTWWTSWTWDSYLATQFKSNKSWDPLWTWKIKATWISESEFWTSPPWWTNKSDLWWIIETTPSWNISNPFAPPADNSPYTREDQLKYKAEQWIYMSPEEQLEYKTISNKKSLDLFKQSWQEDLTNFEKATKLQQEIYNTQKAQEQDSLMRSQAWYDAALIPWRENVISSANVWAATWAQSWISKQIEISNKQSQINDIQVAQKRKDYQKALDAWNLSEATRLDKQITDLQDQQRKDKDSINKAKLDFDKQAIESIKTLYPDMSGLSDAQLDQIWGQYWLNPWVLKSARDAALNTRRTEIQKQESLIRDKAFDNLKSLAEAWVEITPDVASSIFQWAWDVNYWSLVSMWNWISKLKGEERQMAIDKFNLEVQKTKAEINGKILDQRKSEIEKWKTYWDLYNIDPDIAKSFAGQFWVPTAQFEETSSQWPWNPDIVAKIQDIPNWQTYKYNPDDPNSWECWRFGNEMLWIPWFFWDTIISKTSRINTQKPAVWSFAIWGDSLWPNWHVAVVKSINEDNTINVKESWFDRWPMIWGKRIWLVWERPNLDPKYNKVLGYYNPALKEWEMSIDELATWTTRSIPVWNAWFTKDDKMFTVKKIKDLKNEGDIEWLYQIQRDLVLKNPLVQKDLYGRIDFNTWLDLIASSLESFQQSWDENTWYLRSIAEKVANHFWTSTDVELAKASNNIWLFVADYIRSISWTAANDSEVIRLTNLSPGIKNSKRLNDEIIKNLRTRSNELAKTKIDFFLWSKKSIWPKLFPEFYKQKDVNKTTNSYTSSSWKTYEEQPSSEASKTIDNNKL